MISDLYTYSQAIKQLIEEVFNGTVVYDTANNAFEYALNQTKNDIKFPMIAFYPEPNLQLDMSRNSFASYKRGALMEREIRVFDDNMKDTGKTNNKISKSVQNLYINMKYVFDVYGTDRISTEKVTQELLFWLFDNQQVKIKYQGHELNMTFEVDPSVVDNTDLVSYHSNGKLYRYSIVVLLRAPIFRSVDYFNVIKPEIEITVGTEENNMGGV